MNSLRKTCSPFMHVALHIPRLWVLGQCTRRRFKGIWVGGLCVGGASQTCANLFSLQCSAPPPSQPIYFVAANESTASKHLAPTTIVMQHVKPCHQEGIEK